MDTSKSKGGDDHEEEEEETAEEEVEEEKKPKTYDAEEYEDEDKDEEEEVVEEENKDPSDTENGATKKERSPPETGSVSNIEAVDNSRDGDYLEDLPTNQDDNTYYYYDEYENGNRSRYDAAGKSRSFLIAPNCNCLFLLSWILLVDVHLVEIKRIVKNLKL